MLSRKEQLRHHHDSRGNVLELIEFARFLRQTSTNAEGLMWSCLKDRRMNGRKFRRQHPVPPYVLDFYCHELSLGIELDGSQHLSKDGRQHDANRAAHLKQKGIELLRFTNRDVLTNLDNVLQRIWHTTETAPERV